jgi:hypothetical protein
MAGRHAHIRGLATAIHEKSGLGKIKEIEEYAGAEQSTILRGY